MKETINKIVNDRLDKISEKEKWELKVPIFKISTNKIYEGVHWSKRKKMKDNYKLLTTAYYKKLPKINYKVDLTMEFYFKSRALDSSNCSFMAKLLEDCLVEGGILTNDSIKYVGKFTCQSFLDREAEQDYCKILINKSELC